MLDQQPENTTKLATLKKVLLLEEFFSFFFLQSWQYYEVLSVFIINMFP